MTPAQRAIIANRFAHIHAARDRANGTNCAKCSGGFGALGAITSGVVVGDKCLPSDVVITPVGNKGYYDISWQGKRFGVLRPGGSNGIVDLWPEVSMPDMDPCACGGGAVPYNVSYKSSRWEAQQRNDLLQISIKQPTGPRPPDSMFKTDKWGYLRQVLKNHDWEGVGRWYSVEIQRMLNDSIYVQDYWGIATMNLRDYTDEPWDMHDLRGFAEYVFYPYVINDFKGTNKVGFGSTGNWWKIDLSDTNGAFNMFQTWREIANCNKFPPLQLGWVKEEGTDWAKTVITVVGGALIGIGLAYAAGMIIAGATASAGAGAGAAGSAAAGATGATAGTAAGAAGTAATAAAIDTIVVTASALPTISTAAAITGAATGIAAGAVAAPSIPTPSTPASSPAPTVEEVLVEAARSTPSAVSPATVAATTGAGVAATAALVNAPAATATPSVDEIIVEAAKSPTVTPEQTAAATGATAGAVNTVQQAQQPENGAKEGAGGGALDTIKNLVEAIATLLTGGGAGGAGSNAGAGGSGSGINTGVVPVVNQPSALAKAAPWMLLALLVGAVAADQKRKRKNS